MFGVFHLFMGLFGRTGFAIKNEYEAEKAKKNAIENGDDTYWTPHNGTRLVSNDRQVYETIDHGDVVIKDIKNGNVYINKTQNKLNETCEKHRSNGKTAFYISFHQAYNKIKNKPWYSFINENILQDVETRRYLSEIQINKVTFYFDLDSGHILRVSDDYSGDSKVGKLSIEEIISTFNERQDLFYKRHKNDEHKMRFYYYFRAPLQHRSLPIYIDKNKEFVLPSASNFSYNIHENEYIDAINKVKSE